MMSNGVRKSCDGEEISNMFASYFASTYTNDIDHASRSNSPNTSKVARHESSFTLWYIAPEKLLDTLKQLDTTKGAGPDGIPPFFVFFKRDKFGHTTSYHI